VRTHRYGITIFGVLDGADREEFADFRIERDSANTVLIGDLDQAALHGTLNRIVARGLELVELKRLVTVPSFSR
jgi:hypothetical protein